MRLRNKNWTGPFIEQNEKYMVPVIKEGEKINLNNIFKNDNNEFCLEIGSGKGDFVIGQSLKNPNRNFIAMEKETTVVGVALKKALKKYDEINQEMSNIRFLNYFAEKLTDMFEENSFDRLYLNFSDPWPKAKHYKKRLTYRDFLDVYAKILKPNGIIEFKTDNDKLFESSLEEFKERPNLEVQFLTNDLYSNSEFLIDNIPTEYEKKFHEIGKNINKIILKNIK